MERILKLNGRNNTKGPRPVFPTRSYELKDHLGNVRVVMGEQLVGTNGDAPDIQNHYNYYAFGSLQPKRHYNSLQYQSAYNGQRKQDYLKNVGDHNTASFWEYDTRLGRRWNIDPIDQISLSNYATFTNNPIEYSDPSGDYPRIVAAWKNFWWGGDGISKDKKTGEWGVHYSQTEASDEAGEDFVFVTHFQTSGSKHESWAETKQNAIDNIERVQWAEETGAISKMDDGQYHRDVDGKAISEPMSNRDKAKALLAPFILATSASTGAPQLVTAKVIQEGAFAQKLFLSERFGVTSERFGNSYTFVKGIWNQKGSFLKMGWSTYSKSGGGMKFRIGLGTKAANPSQALFHIYVPKTFVPNNFANPAMELKRALYNLEKTAQ